MYGYVVEFMDKMRQFSKLNLDFAKITQHNVV